VLIVILDRIYTLVNKKIPIHGKLLQEKYGLF